MFTASCWSEQEMLNVGDTQRLKVAGALRIVFHRWKTALLLAGVCLVAACTIIKGMTPFYTASVQVILPSMAVEDPSGRKALAQMQTDMFVVRGYTEIFQSDGLCLSVINRLKLGESREFASHPGVIDRALAEVARLTGGSKPTTGPVSEADVARGIILQAYKARLTAKNDNKSLVLAVSFEGADPYLATRIIDAHVAGFVDAQIAYRQKEASIKTEWVKGELDAAAAQMRMAQSAIQLHSQHPSPSIEAAANDATDLRLRQILAQSRQGVYETLLARYQDMLAEQQYVGSDIRVLSRAVVPIKPSFPKPLLFGAIAAFASLLVGFAATTIVTLLTSRESIGDAAAAQDVPVLGRLEIRRRRWSLLSTNTGFRLAQFWENVRSIKSAFDFGGGEGRVLLITSSTSSEGKSITAASLARSVAASGFRTLLLDMNVRKPSFYAPANGGPDLRDYFESGLPPASLLVPLDGAVPLYFLGMCREKTPASLDIFGSARMKSLIDEVRREFDTIIVDAPALEHVADTLFIADLADEAILVAMEGRTTEVSFARAVSALRARNVTLRGTVISDARTLKRTSMKRGGRIGGRQRWLDVWPSHVPGIPSEDKRKGVGAMSHPVAFARTMAKRLP